jgi:hypothetical protein
MLTALRPAGFGGYRRRAPAQRNGLADFGDYRRQVASGASAQHLLCSDKWRKNIVYLSDGGMW